MEFRRILFYLSLDMEFVVQIEFAFGLNSFVFGLDDRPTSWVWPARRQGQNCFVKLSIFNQGLDLGTLSNKKWIKFHTWIPHSKQNDSTWEIEWRKIEPVSPETYWKRVLEFFIGSTRAIYKRRISWIFITNRLYGISPSSPGLV